MTNEEDLCWVCGLDLGIHPVEIRNQKVVISIFVCSFCRNRALPQFARQASKQGFSVPAHLFRSLRK